MNMSRVYISRLTVQTALSNGTTGRAGGCTIRGGQSGRPRVETRLSSSETSLSCRTDDCEMPVLPMSARSKSVRVDRLIEQLVKHARRGAEGLPASKGVRQ
jgi:hypothetical protein